MPNICTTHKVLFIGLDATDWKLLSEKIQQGELPNLAKLIKRGSSGPLRSLRPLFSPALWSTIATGKRPYQHGITGFVLPTDSGKGLRTYQSSSRTAPAIWDMLSSAHRSSNVIGWWNSAPAENIHGIMVDETFRVAQFPSHIPWQVDPTSVSPSSIAEEIASCRVHPQQLPMSLLQRLIPKLYEIDPTVDWRLSAIAKILSEDLTTLQTTLHVMQHHPADFTSLYLIGLDSFSHQGTSFREPTSCHADNLGIEHYGELIDRSYELYDEWIGKLVATAGEETTVVLASDHGFYHDHRKPASLGTNSTAPCDQHSPIGTFIIAGPNIEEGRTIKHATLLDICPTLLALSGLPIGRDMKGKVLSNIFKKPPTLSFVNSWDLIAPRAPEQTPKDPPAKATELALRQLVALGYLPATPQDHQQIISTAYADHLFHQALSFLEHDRIDASIRLLEQAHHNSPDRTDILAKLADCYSILKQDDQAALALKKLVYHRRRDAWQSYQALQTKNYNTAHPPSTIEILEWRDLAARVDLDNEKMHFLLIFADWLTQREEKQAQELCTFAERRPHDFSIVMQAAETALFHGWYDRGLGLLHTLADWQSDESSPLVLIGEYKMRQEKFEEATLFFREALERHPLDFAAWLGLAKSLASQSAWREARESALRATESFLKRSEAYKILSLLACREDPNLARRYEKLSRYFAKRLKATSQSAIKKLTPSRNQEADAADQYYASSKSYLQKPIIVTGLPRSGTSLVMQMLTAGGIDAVTDHQRIADEHNPLGYFEHEKIKEIHRYPELLAPGKAAKVVIPLLWDLPRNLSCHVILIRRPLQEVITSQHRMAGKIVSFEDLYKAYATFEAQTADIIRQRPWSVLQLSHTQLITDPMKTAEKIKDFLGGSLNAKAMAAVVQPSLHRVKFDTKASSDIY